ncbi:SWIM zinc finger family protein [Candidatus Woesearchaeota archaeon]|nr:SWIM zinc finger family protein [Candidatus Woesearchaeota archaeon]
MGLGSISTPVLPSTACCTCPTILPCKHIASIFAIAALGCAVVTNPSLPHGHFANACSAEVKFAPAKVISRQSGGNKFSNLTNKLLAAKGFASLPLYAPPLI